MFKLTIKGVARMMSLKTSLGCDCFQIQIHPDTFSRDEVYIYHIK